MKIAIYIPFILFWASSLLAQNTVGLISHDLGKTQAGYNLIFPHGQSNTYLLNNCGEIAHVWIDSIYRPGNSVFLSEDGLLYRAGGRGAASNTYINAGGGGEVLEIRDWDNNVLWRWAYNDSTVRLHHDFVVTPDETILAIAWERKSGAEAVAAGRNPTRLPDGEVWPDHIIEVEPIGFDSANIIWEWHAWDHLIQDFDSTKANYGDPAQRPELIDINWGSDAADWHHMNAIDYDDFKDQIVLSVPTFNEVWIIDHSTSTSDAAGHTGGFSGKGGDLVFRWGNPAAYRQGDSTDQKLFFQHDIHWIDLGLSNSDPNFGKLMVFNNRAAVDHSTVHIIAPTFDEYDWSYGKSGATFLPENFDWTYKRPDSTSLYSTGLSGAQRLKNGNTLICSGRHGYAFEITDTEEIVWEYKVPLNSGNVVSQGAVLPINANILFRMDRYPADYLAFTGKDLSSKGFIELNPNTAFCDLTTDIGDLKTESTEVLFYPNPTNDQFRVEPSKNLHGSNLMAFDLLGNLVMKPRWVSQKGTDVDVSNWAPGMYLIVLDSHQVGKLLVY